MEVSFWVEEETEENQPYNLTGLRAFTEYEVALRCVAQESAFWSGWSRVHSGTTEEEGKRPDPLVPLCLLGAGGREPGNPSAGAGCLGLSSQQGLPGHRLSWVQGISYCSSFLSRRQEPQNV